MRVTMFPVALVVAMVCGAANAAPVVINFDGFPASSTQPVGTFDSFGVRFNQNIFICGGSCGDLPSSLPNTGVNADSFGGNITGFFLGPVTSVSSISVFAGDNGGDIDTVTLNGYDSANVLVDSASFTGTSAQNLSISGAGIVRFEILETGLIAIDDFTFEASAATVPEPTTLALGGLALLAVGVSRRRAKAA